MSTMSTPDNPLIDAARGRDLVHERGCPALGGYGHGKEACACSAEETQAHKLRTLAAAADKHGQHTYTHWRDSNAAKANEAWCQAASPELVVGLLDRITELEAKEINIEQFRVMVTEAARNPLLKRIVDLETQLAAEAARTAAEKLRADQMSQQHDMQAAMNREARHELAAIRQQKPVARLHISEVEYGLYTSSALVIEGADMNLSPGKHDLYLSPQPSFNSQSKPLTEEQVNRAVDAWFGHSTPAAAGYAYRMRRAIKAAYEVQEKRG